MGRSAAGVASHTARSSAVSRYSGGGLTLAMWPGRGCLGAEMAAGPRRPPSHPGTASVSASHSRYSGRAAVGPGFAFL